MDKPILTLRGSHIHDRNTFYEEMDRVFTGNIDGPTGHNLDAFNDLLRGGFGVFAPGTPVILVWTAFRKSSRRLGRDFTDALLEIISGHPHIEFITEN